MKAIVNPIEFTKILKQMQPVIKKNSVLPILTSVKLSFDSNVLTVDGTDLENSVTTTIPCSNKDAFAVVVEYSDLLSIVSKFYTPVTIDMISENEIRITCDNYKYKISLFAKPSEYPLVPSDKFDLSVSVDFDTFFAIKNSEICRSKEDLKQNLNAPCLTFSKNSFDVCGIDSSMGYIKTISIPSDGDCQVMIPPSVVGLISGFNEADISVGSKFIKFQNGNTTIISRLLEQKYAPYKSVLPTEFAANIYFDKKELQLALQRVTVASDKTTTLTSFEFSKDGVLIKAQDFDFGKEGEAFISISHNVEIEKISVNANQLSTIVNLIDSDIVSFQILDFNKTIYIMGKDDSSIICLLQPLV